LDREGGKAMVGRSQRWTARCSKATGNVDGAGWLEAWGATLIAVKETLQARAVEMAMGHDTEEEDP
jgi:hypothetical protein